VSSLKLKYTVDQFELVQEKVGSNCADVYTMLHCKDGQKVDLRGLKFGVQVKEGAKVLLECSYPEPGIQYISSDQPYLKVDRVKWDPETNVNVKIWMRENSKNEVNRTFMVSVPRPSQPYPSWSWDSGNKVWKAPIPMPKDGKMYYWDESTRSWIEDKG
jgi:hypothetical protein